MVRYDSGFRRKFVFINITSYLRVKVTDATCILHSYDACSIYSNARTMQFVWEVRRDAGAKNIVVAPLLCAHFRSIVVDGDGKKRVEGYPVEAHEKKGKKPTLIPDDGYNDGHCGFFRIK